MKFEDLTPGWKTLVIFGYIFSTVCVILVILLIIMTSPSTSHLIPWPNVEEATKEELEEFDDFLEEFKSGKVNKVNGYKHEIKDLDGNPMLDLLDIHLIT